MITLLATILVGTNAVTFTATSTGIGANTPVEFFLAGKGTDRDYETAFVLDDSIDELARALEKGGLPRGKPMSARRCILWPTGRHVTIAPSPSEFIDSSPLDGMAGFPPFCYTGGSRLVNGQTDAEVNMPRAVLALYDCPQSLIQYCATFPQEVVYGRHVLTNALAKGVRRTFTVSWAATPSYRQLEFEFRSGNATNILSRLQRESAKGDVDVLISFAPEASLAECTAFARALAVIDSIHVRINGFADGNLFFRAFLPNEKWRDRKERLVQPFEVTLDAQGRATAVHIVEDWSGEGLDPKLSEQPVAIAELGKFDKTDTVFFYAPKTLPLRAVLDVIRQLPKTVRVYYVFCEGA